ncbi:MAG TPA: hypothetical protein DCY88_12425 [Cyanobacteria bacterium UBA11372]|nr:hypothetical protein [Cyanobacteria bacterium UBA11372]
MKPGFTGAIASTATIFPQNPVSDCEGFEDLKPGFTGAIASTGSILQRNPVSGQICGCSGTILQRNRVSQLGYLPQQRFFRETRFLRRSLVAV